MNYYSNKSDEVLKELNTSKEGLTSDDAKIRFEKYGANKLVEKKGDSLAVRFLKQLADPMILVLLGAAALSGVTAAYSGESFADVFIILFVVVLNSVLGVMQESKAEQAIAALKTMTAAQSKVYRDGKLTVIKSEELVIGDIIALEAGDAVPADARILECASLQAEESALTGESVPVIKTADIIEQKDTTLGDRKNMVYMGSTVVYGRANAVITKTGMETEMGKIATALSDAEDGSTPLQKKLHSLSKILTALVLCISVVIFGVGILRAGSFETQVMLDSFMVAVSLAVAAIPEGLAAVVTIVLSMGVTKMSSKNAVIRKLTAVETLGCAQIICSDKTGTLTQNKMTVVEEHTDDKKLLAKAMCHCSDAEFNTNINEAVGEPTECALVNYAYKNGVEKTLLRVGEAPFDSMRKMMSTLHSENGTILQFTKGAPDEILKRSTHILTQNGVREITDADRTKILENNKSMADGALRVLACGMREYTQIPSDLNPDKIEKELTFIGMYGMIDPVRPEVKVAVEKCKSAGIRAVMITGDHIDTAVAIAKDLGIITDSSQAVSGSMLDKMSDDELYSNIDKYSVYARVQPEHKTRIVSAWQKHGCVVAMTGDGVNDAPSIKTADIGIGMGITGTDVTKNVADMILADDNFATIVDAVAEGRRIYDNMRKCIQFLLSSNLSEVVGVFFATICGFTLLEPVHILWINLITDSLPALALGMEEEENDIMQRKPRNSKDGVFADGVGFDVVYQGMFVAILTLVAYFTGHRIESGIWEIAPSHDGITMAFLTLSMAEIFQSFNMRSRTKSIFSIKKQNKWLWGAGALALILTTTVIYVPFLKNAFGFTPISVKEYFIALGLALLIIPLVEIVKLIKRTIKKQLKNQI